MIKRKAFTLIELLVVVAIIGILAAVGVVAYNGYTASAKKAVVKQNFKNVVKYINADAMKCVMDGGTIFRQYNSSGGGSNKNCTDTSIDPSSLIEYATIVISQNDGIDNELLFNNLSGLDDDVVVTLRDDPTRFEIPAQTTINGHYFEGLGIGTFNVFNSNDTLLAIIYTSTPFGESANTCTLLLEKID